MVIIGRSYKLITAESERVIIMPEDVLYIGFI